MSVAACRVEIALATYNGERFLGPFLDSLVAQTHPNIALVVSDDGSTDQTTAILESYRDRLEIRFLGSKRLGVVRNFERALAGCSAGYVALADQDDVWHPNKVNQLLEAVQRVEAVRGAIHPALAFSDLSLVNESLGVIAPSFFQATLKSASARTMRDFALDNHAPGCCTLFNKSLLRLALPFPEISIHDWWINILGATVGSVVFCDGSLVDYRQHGGNAIGVGGATAAEGSKVKAALRRPGAFLRTRLSNASARASVGRRQIVALAQRLRERSYSTSEVDRILHLGPWELIKAFKGAETGLRGFDEVLTLFILGRSKEVTASTIETRYAPET